MTEGFELEPPKERRRRGKKKKRVDLDFYETPTWATEALIEYLDDAWSTRVLFEPCAGDGSIAKVLDGLGSTQVYSNDLDRKRDGGVGNNPERLHLTGYDAGSEDCYNALPVTPDWIITNPPFNRAMAILQRAYAHAELGVALFLRLSFEEPTDDRGPWLSQHPPDYRLVVERISFDGSGDTDSVTCAWLVWYTARGQHHFEEGMPWGTDIHWRDEVPESQLSLKESDPMIDRQHLRLVGGRRHHRRETSD